MWESCDNPMGIPTEILWGMGIEFPSHSNPAVIGELAIKGTN